MILYLICAMICFGIFLKLFSEYGLEFSDYIMSIVFGIIVGIFMYLFVSLIIGCALPLKNITENINIYALQDNASIQGSFFLGSGNINGTMKYYYLTKNEDGVIMNTINADNVIIVESSDKPHIEIDKQKFKEGFWNSQIFLGSFETTIKTKIIIPKGSVKYGFNVDLK